MFTPHAAGAKSRHVATKTGMDFSHALTPTPLPQGEGLKNCFLVFHPFSLREKGTGDEG